MQPQRHEGHQEEKSTGEGFGTTREAHVKCELCEEARATTGKLGLMVCGECAVRVIVCLRRMINTEKVIEEFGCLNRRDR